MSEHHDVIVIGSGAGGFVDGRYISEDSWYDVKGKSFFQPQVHYFVGGATKLYGAALYRMRGGLRGTKAPRRHFAALA